MIKVKSGIESIMEQLKLELAAVTKRYTALRLILEDRKATVSRRKAEFTKALAVFQVADKACKTSTLLLLKTRDAKRAMKREILVRNRIIKKELRLLHELSQKIEELKSINLQVGPANLKARATVTKTVHDSLSELTRIDAEAAPIAQMLEVAREHAEFTGPILELIKGLRDKILKERKGFRTSITEMTEAIAKAVSESQTSCGPKDSRKDEMWV